MRVSHNTNAIDFSHPDEMHSDCLIIQNQCSAQCGGGEASSQSVFHNLAAPASSVPAGPLGYRLRQGQRSLGPVRFFFEPG